MKRREFLRRSGGAAAAVLAAPMILPSTVLGANAPSRRITMGIIGCGNQSTIDIPAWLSNEDCQVVAVCDVNRASKGYKTPDQLLGREPQRDFVNRFYAKKNRTGQSKGCAMYTDFRELLARKDIDAVAIIVPDHWHAIMTVLAARAGKTSIAKTADTQYMGREADDPAVRKHNRILQTGSQWRSTPMIRKACELVRDGRIGKVQRVETFVAPNNATGPGPGWKPMPVPEGFDYDFWLGPAAEAPYHIDRCLYRFRFIRDYSGGQTTNFGCHSNDVAQWGLGTDNTGPRGHRGSGREFPAAGDLFNTPTKVAFRARYANGVVLECKTDQRSFGVRFEGTAGWLQVLSKGINAEPKSILEETAAESGNRPKAELYRSENHYRNFLDCVKSRREPIEPVEAGHRTASLCHLGNIAMMLKRKIAWDPKERGSHRRPRGGEDDEAKPPRRMGKSL